MTRERQMVQRFVLRALSRMGDIPMTDEALRDSVFLGLPGSSEQAVDEALIELRDRQYVIADEPELLGRVWTLTPKGRLKARTLG